MNSVVLNATERVMEKIRQVESQLSFQYLLFEKG